jgi:hypothetical protein
MFRPPGAILTPDHPLWRGNVLALLGQHRTLTDSSVYNQQMGFLGDLSNASYEPQNGRWGITSSGTDDSAITATASQYYSQSALSGSAIIRRDTSITGQRNIVASVSDNITVGGWEWTANYGGITTQGFAYNDGSIRGWYTVPNSVPALETFAHVGFTWVPGTFTAYLNGQPIGTAATATNQIVYQSDKLLIGDQIQNQTWNGELADVCIWNVALSDAEMRQLGENLYDPMYGGALWVPSSRLVFWTGGGATGTTIDCTTGAVAIAGQAATVSAGATISCTLGAVAITGLQAEIEQGTTISCSTGAVTIAGQAASVSAGTTIRCTLGTIAITGLQATVTNDTGINCTTGAVTISGLQASIAAAKTIDCTAGAVTITGLQATVSQEQTIDCTLGAIAITGQAATVIQSTNVSCSLGELIIQALRATITSASTTYVPGVEYKLDGKRMHYRDSGRRLHYRATE